MPAPLYDLITPAVNAVFSRQEASLLTTLRKRQLAFNVAPLVWQRLGQGLVPARSGAEAEGPPRGRRGAAQGEEEQAVRQDRIRVEGPVARTEPCST